MMTPAHEECDPLEAVANEFIERCRRGESPSIEDYATQHPGLADEIRDLFPTILTVERVKRVGTGSSDILHAGYEPPLGRLGDFRIVRELGRGGMGIVYEAEQESLGRRVAIKVLPRQHAPDEKRRVRFDREARTAAKLHHTNIVPIFGVGEQDGYRYFVMQYIRGVGLDVVFRTLSGSGARLASSLGRTSAEPMTGDLMRVARELLKHGRRDAAGPMSSASTLTASPGLLSAGSTPSKPSAAREHSGTSGPSDSAASPALNADAAQAGTSQPLRPARERLEAGGSATQRYWRDLAALLAQAADALAYAHSQHVLHRDIKPSNLLLDSDGTLWVADFGLAKAIDHEDVTQAGDVIGTLRYMAPEQFKSQVDARSDVYSLGVTLYELATLRPAFSETKASSLIQAIMERPLVSPRQFCPTMPRDLETILLKATAREPEHRYASAALLRDDLQRFTEDRPILARRISPVERLRRWAWRNPALATMTALSFTLLTAVAVISSAAYFNVRGANSRTQQALDGEKQQSQQAQEQRRRAQDTADLAVEALDAIFNEFAPASVLSAQEMSLTGSENYTVSVPPVISRETAAFLEHMLDFYRKLGRQEAASASLRLKVAGAQQRVGEIHERLGNLEEARTAYQDALGQYELLLADAPQDASLQASLARVHNLMASLLHMNREQREEADEHLDEARRLLQPIYESGHATAEAKFEFARTLYLCGPQFGRPGGPGLSGPGGPGGRGNPEPPPDDKRGAGGRMARPFEGPGHRGPGGPDDPRGGGRRDEGPRGRREDDRPDDRGPGRGFRAGLKLQGPDRGGFGNADEFFKKLGQERADLKQAVTILTDLIAADPQAPQYRHLKALCLLKMPSERPGGPPGGESAEAVELLEALAEDSRFGRISQYRFDLAGAYVMRSLAPQEANRCELLGKAVAIAEGLVKQQPNVPSYQFLLANCLFGQSRQECETNVDRRIERLERAVELNENLAVQVPEFGLMSAVGQLELARALNEGKRSDQARELLLRVIPKAETVAAQLGSRPGPRWLIPYLYEELADTHERLGRADEAEAARLQAEELRRRDPPPAWLPRHDRREVDGPRPRPGPSD